LKEGRVKLIYLDDLKRDPAQPDVPTIAELASNPEDRAVLHLIASSSVIGRSFVAAPGIPEERAKALRDAFDAMMKDPAFLQSAKERSLKVDPMSAAELVKVVQDISATPESIVKTATIATQAPQ